MRSRLLPVVAVAALLMVGTAACGGDEKTPTVPADAVKVHAEDSLKFKPESYATKAGDVTFDYVNDGSQTHTVGTRSTATSAATARPGWKPPSLSRDQLGSRPKRSLRTTRSVRLS